MRALRVYLPALVAVVSWAAGAPSASALHEGIESGDRVVVGPIGRPVFGPMTTTGSRSWSCPDRQASISSFIITPTRGAFLNWLPDVPTATKNPSSTVRSYTGVQSGVTS